MYNRRMALLLFATGWGFALSAETIARDHAAKEAYTDSNLKGGENGGKGFEPWVFGEHLQLENAGIQSSRVNGGHPRIDEEGLSFFLYDPEETSEYLDLFRSLKKPLERGHTLSVDVDVNFRTGYKGLRILGTDDRPLFRLEIGEYEGNDDYTVHDVNGGSLSLGWEYASDTVLRVELTQTHRQGGVWRVLRTGAVEAEREGTYTGTVHTLQFYAFHIGKQPENKLFFNHLQVSGDEQP